MFSYLTGGRGSTTPPPSTYDIVVVGIGAMGNGIGRALIDSPVSNTVAGFDLDPSLVKEFYQYAQSQDKEHDNHDDDDDDDDDDETPSTSTMTSSLEDSNMITDETDVVILVLQTESQCEQVCFGSSGDNSNKKSLLELLPNDCCVILCSTVTSSWTMKAAERFEAHGIANFVDAPISGGPVRARDGELTIMSSGSDSAINKARPVLEAMASQDKLYVVGDKAGTGSTVKMIHQSLAGIHIVAAAEALSLGAKAGCDVQQLYEIVCGAAGSSWMFRDRGQRMMSADKEKEIKSQLQIFVKDLDIVYNEAKKLQVPIPLASAALQQFVAGQSLGLSRQDDSSVVKVYEKITGVPVSGVVAAAQKKKEADSDESSGNEVGDTWIMKDGNGKLLSEKILEVGDEPRHKIVLSNEYIRAIRVHFPPGDSTLAHRHEEDSLYFFLTDDSKFNFINHVMGQNPVCDCVEPGEIRYGTHKTDKPLIHKITNNSSTWMLCVDAEVLKKPPVTAILPLMDSTNKHELVKKRDKCRVYKLTLEPNESVTITYNFFHLSVILSPSTIEKSIANGAINWIEENLSKGDVSWKEPTLDITKTNVGNSTYMEYIAEWC